MIRSRLLINPRDAEQPDNFLRPLSQKSLFMVSPLTTVMPQPRLTFVLLLVTLLVHVASSEVLRTQEADVVILSRSSSGKPHIEKLERFAGRGKLLRRRSHIHGRRVPAPPARDNPTPLPVFPPLPSPSGPCNVPIVKLAAIKDKCHHRKSLFTPWVEVSLFTTCFTRSYFVRWKFCYKKKICDRRVARFRKCIFPGMIRCQGTEDLTCPTFVVLRCAKKQPTELIMPKIQ